MSLRHFGSSRCGLLVLAYHRIADMSAEDEHPGDPELVSASLADFEWQMQLVARHFQPITFRRVIECLEGGTAMPQRSLVVTFDDGHLDNYTGAFPILRSLGIPATIFLSTGYIGSQEPYWFDHVARLLAKAPSGPIQLTSVPFKAVLLDMRSRRSATEALLGLLKRVANSRRLDCLDELDRLFPSRRDGSASNEQFALSWPQVREMAAAGIEFGSHTVSHPILTQVDDVQLRRELSESREAIVAHTGQAGDIIAYPIGKRFAFDERVIRACEASGYRLGVSYETGTNPSVLSARFELKRLAVERYTNRAMFQSMLSLPGLLAR